MKFRDLVNWFLEDDPQGQRLVNKYGVVPEEISPGTFVGKGFDNVEFDGWRVVNGQYCRTV